MRNLPLRLLLLVAGCLSGQSSFGLTCEPSSERHAVKISAGPVDEIHRGDPSSGNSVVELYGTSSFYQQLDNGWVFTLIKNEYGWSLRLREDNSVGAVDLSSITPPYQSTLNSREIFGWHFRNADNSGPNTGEVNAPQLTRLFAFSEGLVGTGGFKPSTDPQKPRFELPAENDGRGWLQILDYGLRNLAVGKRAQMNYLKFSACLTWPKSADEILIERDLASYEYTDENIEQLGACGFDFGVYELLATRLPRILTLDFDGDETFDVVAQVSRRADGRRGLAVCRAGTWPTLFGYSKNKVAPTIDDYLQQVEAWEVVAAHHGPFGFENEPPWPITSGDILVLDRIEKARVMLYWNNDAFQIQHVYHFVEP